MSRSARPATGRWWLLAVVTLVAFVTNVDGTIVVVALPRLMAGLRIAATTGLWTLTAYLITSTVLLLPAGRWSDVAGRRRTFLAGLAVFTAATIACGAAPSGTFLVAARFVQGAGAALGLATAVPLIVQVFPPGDLGRALGVNSTAWVLGAIVGPVAGGALVASLGWRVVFFVTVPFGGLGLLGGWWVLRPDARTHGRAAVDWTGAALFGLALVAALLALSEGLAWGWGATPTVVLLAAAAGLGLAFAARERRTPAPLFDTGLLRHRHYRSGLGVVLLYMIALSATTFLLTFYLQGALHLGPLAAGLALVPLAAPQLVLAPLGGHLADRIGPARLVLVGLLVLTLGAWLLGQLGPRLSLPLVVGPLLLMSAANALAWPSLTKAMLSAAPPARTGVASGMYFTLRNVGMALSLTLALLVAEASLSTRVATRVFLGTAGVLAPRSGAALVHATDAGFHLFAGFYLAAFVLGMGLLGRVARPLEHPAHRAAAEGGAG